MVSERQALSAWQDVLEEEIGVDEAALVVDRVGDVVTRAVLDRLDERIDAKLERLEDRIDAKLEHLRRDLGHELTAAWRRDLLVIGLPQIVALLALLLGLGA